MQIFLLLTVLSLAAAPIYAEGEALTEKKVDKREVLGLGYGGYAGYGSYGGYYGLDGYGSYGQHGYLNAPAYPVLGHAVAPSYSRSYTAPISIDHGYTSPVAPVASVAPVAPIAPVYTLPRLGYNGLGHGFNYNTKYSEI